MFKFNKIKKVFAFGLVDVLVGLAITGGVLIAITSVSISAYREVQDNELADKANSIVLMGIEFFKTPISDINQQPTSVLNNITVIDSPSAYSINTTDPNNFSVTYRDNDPSNLTDCSEDSLYIVHFPSGLGLIKNPILCNKIVIVKKASGGYMITSSIAYKFYNGIIMKSTIVGYRQHI